MGYYDYDTDDEEYYDRHPEDVPDGCRECGGPYPNCCDSCPLYDD